MPAASARADDRMAELAAPVARQLGLGRFAVAVRAAGGAVGGAGVDPLDLTAVAAGLPGRRVAVVAIPAASTPVGHPLADGFVPSAVCADGSAHFVSSPTMRARFGRRA